jgi:hypothetical protein
MLHVIKSLWRDRWYVYEIDTGGWAWLATFRRKADAFEWVQSYYLEQDAAS